MVFSDKRQRHGKASPWLAAGLFLTFGLLAAHQLVTRDRRQANPGLIRELQSVRRIQGTTHAELHGDWPQWRGPRRDGVARTGEWEFDWPRKGPPLLWEYPKSPVKEADNASVKSLEAGYSSLAVACGRLFTLFH